MRCKESCQVRERSLGLRTRLLVLRVTGGQIRCLDVEEDLTLVNFGPDEMEVLSLVRSNQPISSRVALFMVNLVNAQASQS